MTFRKTIITTIRHDDVNGETITIKRRAWQPLRKDGSDAKRAPHMGRQCLSVTSDGSWRYYGREGVLRRERVSAERQSLEERHAWALA